MKYAAITDHLFKIIMFCVFLMPRMHLHAMDITVSRKSETETHLSFGSPQQVGDSVKETAVFLILEPVTTGMVRFSESLGEVLLRERPFNSLFVRPWPRSKNNKVSQGVKERVRQFLLPQDYIKKDMPLWKKVTILGVSPLIGAATVLALKQALNKLMLQDSSINNALDGAALSRLFDLIPSSDIYGEQINNGASMAVLLGAMSEETAKSRILWAMHFIAWHHTRQKMGNYLD